MSGGLDRRRLLQAGGAGLAAALFSSPAARAAELVAAPASTGPATASRGKPLGTKVYVLVVDGCRPTEIAPLLTPRLARLKAAGTWYSNARSMPVAETIPNHMMMMTGVRPDRSGVPANSIFDRAERVVRDLDRPSDLRFPTLLDRLRRCGLVTASVLSKEYLFGIVGTRANYRWEPAPTLPITEHAPDVFTTDAAIAMVDAHDPDFMFVNLGDIDRFGHSDPTGPSTLAAARKLALADTDVQVGRFVDHLVATGRWPRTTLIVLADHSMDWSLPTNVISLGARFDADPLLTGRTAIAQNGGADLLYWIGPAGSRSAALNRMRSIALGTPGVLSVLSPSSLRLGTRAGDLVVYCKPGWRFSDPKPTSNPIPGNHGHPATFPIPFLVSGGRSVLRRGAVVTKEIRTIDVAPLVGSIFGLPTPSGGYDGVLHREWVRT